MKFVYFTSLLVITLTSSAFTARQREHLTSGTTNYHTEDGNERHEELEADGTLKGHYSYIDPNGKRVSVNYVAGKDGFKATGDHFAVFNLGDTKLENVKKGVHTSIAEDSDPHSSTNIHKKVPSYQTHKEVASYRPSHDSFSQNTQQEISSFRETHDESPVTRYEIQRPKPRPDVHYRPDAIKHYKPETQQRPEPVQQYKPKIQETYENHANLNNGQNEHAISYVSHENEETHEQENDDDDEEEDHSYDAQSYSTYRPPASKSYYTTKAPAHKPTFKPYFQEEEEPSFEYNPVTTKFSIKHPSISSHDSESYSIPETQHKVESTPVEYPDLKTKTTYHSIPEDSRYENQNFGSQDHLANFDTTKLLNDYHNNKPSISKQPFPTTKFTIEDVSTPNHGNQYLPKPENGDSYSFDDLKSEKAPEYTYSDLKSGKTPEYTFSDFKSDKAPEYTYSDLKSGKTPEYTFSDFKSEKAPEYTFSDLKSEKAPEYTFTDFKSQGTPEYNFNDFKSQKAPEFSTTKFNEFNPENFKQPDFANFFKTESSPNDFQKVKPQEEDVQFQFLNSKNPAHLGQYQQFLKSTEDEKIEQQYIREQLKFAQQPNSQRKRPTYSRPNLSSYHPGRRPPKRPSTSPGLGTYRTTFKIPFGFHI